MSEKIYKLPEDPIIAVNFDTEIRHLLLKIAHHETINGKVNIYFYPHVKDDGKWFNSESERISKKQGFAIVKEQCFNLFGKGVCDPHYTVAVIMPPETTRLAKEVQNSHFGKSAIKNIIDLNTMQSITSAYKEANQIISEEKSKVASSIPSEVKKVVEKVVEEKG